MFYSHLMDFSARFIVNWGNGFTTMLVLKLLHQPELSMEVLFTWVSLKMKPLLKILLQKFLVCQNPCEFSVLIHSNILVGKSIGLHTNYSNWFANLSNYSSLYTFFFWYEVSPRPYSYNVPRSLNDWPTKVVVEPSERIYYLSGPNN